VFHKFQRKRICKIENPKNHFKKGTIVILKFMRVYVQIEGCRKNFS